MFCCSEPTLETQQAAGLISDAEKCKLLLSRYSRHICKAVNI